MWTTLPVRRQLVSIECQTISIIQRYRQIDSPPFKYGIGYCRLDPGNKHNHLWVSGLARTHHIPVYQHQHQRCQQCRSQVSSDYPSRPVPVLLSIRHSNTIAFFRTDTNGECDSGFCEHTRIAIYFETCHFVSPSSQYDMCSYVVSNGLIRNSRDQMIVVHVSFCNTEHVTCHYDVNLWSESNKL